MSEKDNITVVAIEHIVPSGSMLGGFRMGSNWNIIYGCKDDLIKMDEEQK